MDSLFGEYDIILSAGLACRPAISLKRNNLRLFSVPQEYMMRYGLDALAKLYETCFANFFVDITYEGAHSDKYWVKDNATEMVSIHHFPLSLSKARGYVMFHETMRNRIARMYRMMYLAENMLFLSNRNESIESLAMFRDRINSVFPGKKFKMLNVISCNEDIFELSRTADGIYQAKFNDAPSDASRQADGNIQKWDLLLSKFRVSKKIAEAYASMKSTITPVKKSFLQCFDAICDEDVAAAGLEGNDGDAGARSEKLSVLFMRYKEQENQVGILQKDFCKAEENLNNVKKKLKEVMAKYDKLCFDYNNMEHCIASYNKAIECKDDLIVQFSEELNVRDRDIDLLCHEKCECEKMMCDIKSCRDKIEASLDAVLNERDILLRDIFFLSQYVPNSALSKIHFDEKYYLEVNKDVGTAITQHAIGSGLQHWLLYGFQESRSVLFSDDAIHS
ncbi:hypothetical protein [Solidesulfovibrio sp.]|uniref:hypothetical protein n=2 Tax=Solidesulfovibrio sp. TaxID=2910990 RepID=UPI002B1FB682|nr:hypothetical protein [Solidesulfovibrio sp.]MEA4858762.1 hypothetical protein [Solidesulfovibrio sp.]